MILNGLPWKRTEIILSFVRLHLSTAFWTLLLTMMATPLYCPKDPSLPQLRPGLGSIVLPFLEFHRHVTALCVVMLASPCSIMHLGFIHVVDSVSSLFFFIAE